MRRHLLSRALVAVAAGASCLAVAPGMGAAAAAPPGAAAAPSGAAASSADATDDDGGVPVARVPAGRAVPGHYIVTLRDGVDAVAVAGERTSGPSHVYDAVLNGFAAQLSDAQLAALRADDRVVAIEEDQVVSVDETSQFLPPWHLGRIDDRYQSPSGMGFYNYVETGDGVRVYVIDTGIHAAHSQFGSRAIFIHNASGDGISGDCHGHGTHVAGIVGASTYGVAKQSLLRGVKVLGCSGAGSMSAVIAGVNWVRNNALRPAVANMSLGGWYSHALNSAVTALSYSGVFVAAAAGNDGDDACNHSPASSLGAVTVAATHSSDFHAGFSNRGPCVDLYAPGVGVLSTWNNGSTMTLSGTSMASPVVAGVAALRKDAFGDLASTTLRDQILADATTNVLIAVPAGTPNRLVYKAPTL